MLEYWKANANDSRPVTHHFIIPVYYMDKVYWISPKATLLEISFYAKRMAFTGEIRVMM